MPWPPGVARTLSHARPLLPKDGWALVINQKGNMFCSHFFLQKSPNNILLACHVNTNRQADTFKDFFFFTKTALTNLWSGYEGISREEVPLHTHTHAA